MGDRCLTTLPSTVAARSSAVPCSSTPVVNAPAKVLLSMIGMSAIWTYPTDHGLAVALSLELK